MTSYLRPLHSARALVLLGLAWLLPAAPGYAAPPVMFLTADQNPFIQIHSLPWPADAAPAPAGRWSLGLVLDVANNSIERESGDGEERIVIDGETWRGNLVLAYGFSQRLQAGVTIPLVAHQGGLFDGFIREWHDTFGLTNSRRDVFADYALDYLYSDAAGDGVHVDRATNGIGDIRLTADWRLHADADAARRYTLRAGFKVPTGRASQLHGSGGTDLSLQLLSSDSATLDAINTTLSWMVGGLWLGDGEVLEAQRRDMVAIGSIGVVVPVWRGLMFKAQFDGHTSFYDSTLEVLGADAVQLLVGAGIRIGEAGMIDLGLTENLFTDTTPDFGLHLAWHSLL